MFSLKYKLRLLGSLFQAAVQVLLRYFRAITGTELWPVVVASIQIFGQKINLHRHIYCLRTEGGEDFEATFQMRTIAFITDYAVVDRIVNHLKLTFVASKPPASGRFSSASCGR